MSMTENNQCSLTKLKPVYKPQDKEIIKLLISPT
jgi:hypothetical protein